MTVSGNGAPVIQFITGSSSSFRDLPLQSSRLGTCGFACNASWQPDSWPLLHVGEYSFGKVAAVQILYSHLLA